LKENNEKNQTQAEDNIKEQTKSKNEVKNAKKEESKNKVKNNDNEKAKAQASEKEKKILGWKPCHDTLEEIIASAWNWHKNHPNGYND